MGQIRWLTIPLLIALAVGLGTLILSLPDAYGTLQEHVASELEASGVKNPVTAVLLNFRVYDTLLEMTVLLVAVLGVCSFGGRSLRVSFAPGPVLEIFTTLSLPLLILVAAYLLWVGAYGPGGAFQAGAVLGAAGILLALSDRRPPVALRLLWTRLALCAGAAAFAAVAVGTLLSGGALLQYPQAHAGELILFMESAATLAIAITLTLLFMGRTPIKGSNSL